MPPNLVKSKSKGREGRRSRSRNTTPSSSVSVPLTSSTPSHTAFLELALSSLMVPSNISYDSVLERHGGGGGGIPDPTNLEFISNDLKTLAQLASARNDVNNKGMRGLSERRKHVVEEERAREREQARLEAEEARRNVKREGTTEDERERKTGRPKKKGRLATTAKRPPAHGAHGLARQDGLDIPLEAEPNKRSSSPLSKPEPSRASTSPLSEASPIQSPTVRAPEPSTIKTPSPESDASSEQQPPPMAAQPQFQTFGTNPLTFDDPTVYDIRPVTDDMTDEEKREIYCVASFPKSDLSDLIAGTPPNKDFSNAQKPSNQVHANTFQSYLEGYLRPLKEEDIGFLNERGDRVTPFVLPPRGKRHYTGVWAEEDGSMAFDAPEQARLPPNQARGSLEEMNDEIAETDQVSAGPTTSRFLSLLRYEHRAPQNEEKPQPNGVTNGDSSNFNADFAGLPDLESVQETMADTVNKPKSLPPATALPENARSTTNLPNLSASQMDERLKAELRHIGFLSADDEPEYDAHNDDEVAERLRWLQDRLKKVSILNGCRKRRVLELAEEQLAYQEYSTILEDLDGQVQQAYLKRARTAGKSKKNTTRPAPGQQGSLGAGVAVSKPGIGDVARQLMNRRARWEEKIGPVFRGDIRRVRGKGEGIFGEREMERLTRAEREMFDEEGE